MKYIEGYPIQETAKIIRIPTGTVKSRLSRARKALRCIMESRHYYTRLTQLSHKTLPLQRQPLNLLQNIILPLTQH
ncbi:MAG: hypothetical protein HFJ07_17465 [Lachnospiraceae bacterium]|nr:hypothetical protein [Lachnospiraceae bacterium]